MDLGALATRLETSTVEEPIEVGAQEELPAEHHRMNPSTVRDLLERIGVEQEEIGMRRRSDEARRLFWSEVARRVEGRRLKSPERREPGLDEQGQFAVQAESRQTALARGVGAGEDLRSGSVHSPNQLLLRPPPETFAGALRRTLLPLGADISGEGVSNGERKSRPTGVVDEGVVIDRDLGAFDDERRSEPDAFRAQRLDDCGALCEGLPSPGRVVRAPPVVREEPGELRRIVGEAEEERVADVLDAPLSGLEGIEQPNRFGNVPGKRQSGLARRGGEREVGVEGNSFVDLDEIDAEVAKGCLLYTSDAADE